jgi:predicted DNA-binding antitoxin AbrB/MazE fold protein
MEDEDDEIIWIASFDIGKCNFSFYVEEINLTELKSIKNIKKEDRYFNNGTCTKEFSSLMEKIYKNGNNKLLKNVNLTDGTDKEKYFDSDICYNMFDVLDEYKEYWDKVSYVIVEKQMAFGKKINTMALKLGQSCQSYFMLNYSRDLKVIEFPAYYKTLVLGAQQTETKTKTGKIKFKTLGDRERKKWSVQEGFYIMSLREDFETMSDVGVMKKRDDVNDVLIQLQAFKYLYFVDNMKF